MTEYYIMLLLKIRIFEHEIYRFLLSILALEMTLLDLVMPYLVQKWANRNDDTYV